MLKKTLLSIAMLSTLALAAAVPGYAQNTQNQSGQDQMTPGASPSDNNATQTPRHKNKKKKHSNSSGQTNKDTTGQADSPHPGNSNQTGVPSTQPGGAGTQSGANPK